MRKYFALFLALLLSVLFPACAEMVDFSDETTGFRAVIDDQAGIIAPDDLGKIQEAMKNVTAFCDVGFVTGSGYGSAERLAESWALSVFGNENTIVFAIDMGARDLCIASENDMRGRFTVQDANTVTDNQYRKATIGRYADCAIGVFEEIGNVLRGEKIARPMKYVSNVLIALCFAILICFLIISSDQKRRNPEEATVITAAVAAGAGTAVLAKKLTRTVRHESSSGGGIGHGGGGGGHSGGGSFSSGSHGF